MKARALLAATIALVACLPASIRAADDAPKVSFPFEGIFGAYDRPTLRRGLQIYREICGNCHALDELSYRNLSALGYTPDEIKQIAGQYEVTDGPDSYGAMYQRPARPNDSFVDPFPNDAAARVANNGSQPPDLALVARARAGGAHYVYDFLLGFHDPPSGMSLSNGTYYNSAFPGHMVAMPPMLTDHAVTFADGAPNDLRSEAYDVASFLQWAADPHLGRRNRMGRGVLLFLIVTAVLLYATWRRVWGTTRVNLRHDHSS